MEGTRSCGRRRRLRCARVSGEDNDSGLREALCAKLLGLQLHVQKLLQHDKLLATVGFAVGVSGGEKDRGLCDELFQELKCYMLPAWAGRGADEV